MAMASKLDRWIDLEIREWPEHKEAIVHLRHYAEMLVLHGSAEVAARAGRLLLDHPPVAATSRMAMASRFPQGD